MKEYNCFLNNKSWRCKMQNVLKNSFILLLVFLFLLLVTSCNRNEKKSPNVSQGIDNADSTLSESSVIAESDEGNVSITETAINSNAQTGRQVVEQSAAQPVNEQTTAQPATQQPATQQPVAEQPVETPPPPVVPSIPGNFVRINGGSFTMGSQTSEQGRSGDEGPPRLVAVSSFYIGKFPVTQAEYQTVMGNNPSSFRGSQLPVEMVDWFDAIEYCNRRSQREGLTSAYNITGSGSGRTVTWVRDANGYRLLTEAEWEYACRAGSSAPFIFGSSISTNQGNYDGTNPYDPYAEGEDRQRTTNVGSFPANRWGLHDMHGNVYEWCWDWLDFPRFCGQYIKPL